MKSDSTPLLQDAEIPLSAAELEVSLYIIRSNFFLKGCIQVLRRQYIKEGEYVTIQTKFNYAWGLIKSSKSDHIELGIKLLTGNREKASYRAKTNVL